MTDRATLQHVLTEQEQALAASAPATDAIAQLLEQVQLATIPAGTPLPIIEERLRALREQLNGADPLRRLTVIKLVGANLEAAAVMTGATSYVTAALKADAPVAPGVPDPIQGSALALTEPELWPETVSGTTLLDELAFTVSRFIVLPEWAVYVFPLHVIHAHAHEAFDISPITAFRSPEKRSGKTTAVSLYAALVPRAILASNVTSAALFRTVEMYRPTLIIDEADTFMRQSDELRGILNSGHLRVGAHVIRTVGDTFEPRVFSTWCAKTIALIGDLSGTLEDRAIEHIMRRKRPDEFIEKLRADRLPAELSMLQRKAARWARDHLATLRTHEPATPAELHDRAADNWRPLLAIADLAGGDWPERARRAARAYSVTMSPEGDSAPAVQLLADLKELFNRPERASGENRLASAGIVAALKVMEERPWPEWKRGKPITERQLARLLRPFGIRPRLFRIAGTPCRGYDEEDFTDVWVRYVPDPPPEPVADPLRPLLPNGGAANLVTDDPLPLQSVTNPEPGESAGAACEVTVVTDPDSVMHEQESEPGDGRGGPGDGAPIGESWA